MATEPVSGSDTTADKVRSSAHTEEAEAGFPARSRTDETAWQVKTPADTRTYTVEGKN